MLNAVTEFVDHRRGGQGSVEPGVQAKRLHSAWFGAGAQLKQRTWDTLARRQTSLPIPLCSTGGRKGAADLPKCAPYFTMVDTQPWIEVGEGVT